MTDINSGQSKQVFRSKHFKRKPNFNPKKVYEARKKGKNRKKGNFHEDAQSKNHRYKTGTNVNVCEQQPDSELFFFDISGNKSNLEAVTPCVSKNKLNDKQNRIKTSKIFLSKYKWRRDGIHGAQNFKSDSTNTFKENKNSNSPLLELRTPKKKNKKKKHKTSDSKVSPPNINACLFREIGGNFKERISMNISSDKKEIASSFKKRFSTNIPPLNEQEFERSFKKRAQIFAPPSDKTEIESFKARSPPQKELHSLDKGRIRHNFKEKNLVSIPLLDELETSKKKHQQILIDIRDSDCEMVSYDIFENEKRKKKQNKPNQVSSIQEHINEEPDTNNEICTAQSNQFKNKEHYLNESVSSTDNRRKKDRLQDGNEVNIGILSDKSLREEENSAPVIDIPDSDYESAANARENDEVSNTHNKKKKRKHKISEGNSPRSECNMGVVALTTRTSSFPVHNLLNNNVQLNDKNISSKDENQLISEIIQQIKSDISYFKKRKKKNSEKKKHNITGGSTHNSPSYKETLAGDTMESNNPNKKREVVTNSPIFSVDIRDSECEMTIINDGYRKKKKSSKHSRKSKETISDHSNGENCEDLSIFNGSVIENVDADVIPPKKKKKKHLENDTNELGSDGKLNSNQSMDSNVKKKKKHKIGSSESELEMLERSALSVFKKKSKRHLENELTESYTVGTPRNKHRKISSDDKTGDNKPLPGTTDTHENSTIKEEEVIFNDANTFKKRKDKNSKRKFVDEIIKINSLNDVNENAEKKTHNEDSQNGLVRSCSPNCKKKKRKYKTELENVSVEEENSNSLSKTHKWINSTRASDEDISNISVSGKVNKDNKNCDNIDSTMDKDMEVEKNLQDMKRFSLESSWQFEDEESEIEQDNMILKWQRLIVNTSFETAPLHALLTRTTYPTKEQTDEIKRLNLEVKCGPFTKKEDEKILANWMEFCKIHDFPMKPKLFVTLPRGVSQDKKVEFLRYISQGLDNRMIHRVHARFKSLMSKETARIGRFTSEEDRQILEYMNESLTGRPFSHLSKIMGRTRDALFKRYRRLIATQNWTVHWTPELINSFLEHLQKITKVADVNELEYRKITLKEWKKLSKKMSPIPVIKLQLAWQNTIYPRLFVCEGVDLREIKAKIIKRLIKRNETDWRAVDWEKVTKKFPGFSSHKIYMMFKQLVIFHVPKEKQGNLKECLSFLNDKLLIYNNIPTTHPLKKINISDNVEER